MEEIKSSIQIKDISIAYVIIKLALVRGVFKEEELMGVETCLARLGNFLGALNSRFDENTYFEPTITPNSED